MKIVKRDHLTRVAVDGAVHFACGTNRSTICGRAFAERDLFGNVTKPMKVTDKPVNCPECARMFCEVKNTVWNAVDSSLLERATYDAFDCEPPKKGNEQ